MADFFIVRKTDGDSIGYVTLHHNGVQFQADDDVYTGKLSPRESIELAEAILDKYSTEYVLLKGSVRKCAGEIHDTVRAPMRMDGHDD
jgi:hypothetical protein